MKQIENTTKKPQMPRIKVDGKKIKADTYYSLKNGKFVEEK